MILDALKYLVALGKETNKVQRIQLPGDQVMIVAGNNTEKFQNNRHLRVDAPTSLADLLDWVTFVLSGEPASDEVDVECFVHSDKVCVVINRERTVSDNAKLSLIDSAEMLAVRRLLAGPISQKDLITMFRGPLAKAIKPHYLPSFRGIQFRSVTNSDRNQSSLGRSVEMEVSSTSGQLPDEITLEMPIYDLSVAELGLATINLAVETNFDTERFEFLAVADTLSIAVTMARKEIRALLVDGLPSGSMVVLGANSTVKATE